MHILGASTRAPVPAAAFSKKNCLPRLSRFLSRAILIAACAFSLIGQAAPHAPAIHPARAQVSASSTQRQQPAAIDPAAIDDIQRYIAHAWTDLTRSMNQCQSLEDAKTAEPPVLYLPAELSGAATPPAVTELQTRCHIQLERLAPHHYRPRPNRSRCASEKRPAVPRKPLRRSRRPVQRDVWLGQLFHHPRPVEWL